MQFNSIYIIKFLKVLNVTDDTVIIFFLLNVTNISKIVPIRLGMK